MSLRRLGNSDLQVTSVAMGCWPIAGITSIGTSEQSSLETVAAAVDSGINFFDTAYMYGYDGESERMLGKALKPVRDKVVIASKGGIHYSPDKKQTVDGRPETILRECDESLRRLDLDVIDLHYLHKSDPQVPVQESAGAFVELQKAGKIREVGVSNFSSLQEYSDFYSVCPFVAVQPPYNMLQRDIEADLLPWCQQHNVAAVIYWPLMKGFLAGKLSRDHVWDPKDSRTKYPVFQGEEWAKTHDFIDKLRVIADDAKVTVAQLVIAWTIQQPGITSALCGAKRPEQIRETAVAMNLQLTADQLKACQAAIESRGPVA